MNTGSSNELRDRQASDESIRSAACCRICQLDEQESGEPLDETACRCLGDLSLAHRSCLLEWSQEQRSNICEICKTEFGHVVLATTPVNVPDNELAGVHRPSSTFRSENLSQQIDPDPVVCNLRRRTWFTVIIILMVLATCSAGAMTLYTYRAYRQLLELNWSQPFYVSQHKLDDHRFFYGLSLCILVFSSSILVGFVGLWIFAEMCLNDEVLVFGPAGAGETDAISESERRVRTRRRLNRRRNNQYANEMSVWIIDTERNAATRPSAAGEMHRTSIV